MSADQNVAQLREEALSLGDRLNVITPRLHKGLLAGEAERIKRELAGIRGALLLLRHAAIQIEDRVDAAKKRTADEDA